MKPETVDGMVLFSGEDAPRKFTWTVFVVGWWKGVHAKRRKRNWLIASVLLWPALGGLFGWMMNQPYHHDLNFIGGVMGLVLLTVGSICIIFVLPVVILYAWFDMNKTANAFIKAYGFDPWENAPPVAVLEYVDNLPLIRSSAK